MGFWKWMQVWLETSLAHSTMQFSTSLGTSVEWHFIIYLADGMKIDIQIITVYYLHEQISYNSYSLGQLLLDFLQ